MRMLSIAVLASGVTLRLCGPSSAPPGQPQHGGVVQASGNYFVELVPEPEGKLSAYVRDGTGGAPPPAQVELGAEVRPANGPPASVALVHDPDDDRYEGTLSGVPAGTHPVEVTLGIGPSESKAEFPAVALSVAPGIAAAAHGGVVTIAGEQRLEVVAAPAGEVHVYVTEPSGAAVPIDDVELPSVTMHLPAGPRVVPLRKHGAYFVGTLGAPLPPRFGAGFSVRVRGKHHPHVLVPGVVLSAARPRPVSPAQLGLDVAEPSEALRDVLRGERPSGPLADIDRIPIAPVRVPAPPAVIIGRPGVPRPPAIVIGRPGAPRPPPPAIVVPHGRRGHEGRERPEHGEHDRRGRGHEGRGHGRPGD